MGKKIIVIGAGISGLSAAKFLSDFSEVELLESAAKVGGLVKCDYISGSLFHKVGGHVFNAKNKEVSDWFWAHFDRESEFIKAKRNAKILFNQRLIGYPIENHLYEFGKDIVQQVINDLLEIQLNEFKDPLKYKNFEAFLRGNFGNTLYELYFRPYNQKLWNVDLSQVALEWLEGKLPMPNIHDIILSNIVKEEESHMVHSTFYYAKSGGSQFIADRLASELNIRTSYSVNKINRNGNSLLINDSIMADNIVFTGDVRELSKIIKIKDAELEECLFSVKDLKSNGTSNLFCKCDENDLSWLYIPEKFTKAHRIIYTGNFSPENNKGSNRKTCVVEFSGKVPLVEMEQEIKSLPGNLTPISSNYEARSYVIQEADTRQKINKIKQKLQDYGIFLTGRFAEWEYYNMDKAIEASMKLAQMIKK